MNNNKKRDLQIAYFNSLNCATEFIPEEEKGTEEGYKKACKYQQKFFNRFKGWYKKLNKE